MRFESTKWPTSKVVSESFFFKTLPINSHLQIEVSSLIFAHYVNAFLLIFILEATKFS